MLGVGLKGLQALVEGVCGLLLLFVDTDTIKLIVQTVTQIELKQHPSDFLAAYVFKLSEGFSIGAQHFYAFYFIGHGLVKLFLVGALLKNKPWSYPAAMVALGLFVVVQCVRLATGWSWPLLCLVALDLIVIGLIYREYRSVRRERDRMNAGSAAAL